MHSIRRDIGEDRMHRGTLPHARSQLLVVQEVNHIHPIISNKMGIVIDICHFEGRSFSNRLGTILSEIFHPFYFLFTSERKCEYDARSFISTLTYRALA